jgi:catechol 2,3-dioxygenase-like lactoylglutathione lyase family enzyme
MNYKPGIVIFMARDLERARSFYADTLGLLIIDTEPNFITLSTAGDCLIGLQSTASLKPGETAEPGSTELGLEVSDADAAWRELKARGVTTLTDLADMPFGRTFDLRDPDGHLLTIYRPNQR